MLNKNQITFPSSASLRNLPPHSLKHGDLAVPGCSGLKLANHENNIRQRIKSYQQRKRAHVQDQNRKRNIQNNQNE
jgi:hypothetical protein